MGETQPLFTTSFNRSLSVESRPERLTGDAGAVLLREILERSGIVPWLVRRLNDPRHADFVTYLLDALLRTVLVLLGQGWRDQDDADAMRCASIRPCGWRRRMSEARHRLRRAAIFPPSRRCRDCLIS